MGKVKNKFDIIQKPLDTKYIGEWNGVVANETILLEMYIKEKYKNDFYSVPFVDLFIGYSKDDKENQLWLTGFYIDRNVLINKDSIDKISDYIQVARNTKKRFSYYSIHHTLLNGIGHAVGILYDKMLGEIEIFDMNSDSHKEFIKLKKKIKLLMEAIYHPGIPINYVKKCDKFGDLETEKDCNDYTAFYTKYNIPGSCMIWTLWYLELRLKNKNLSRDLVVNKAIKKFTRDPQLVCKIIVGYAQFIEKFIKDYSVIYKNNKFKPEIIKKGIYKFHKFNLSKSLLINIFSSLAIAISMYRYFKKTK